MIGRTEKRLRAIAEKVADSLTCRGTVETMYQDIFINMGSQDFKWLEELDENEEDKPAWFGNFGHRNIVFTDGKVTGHVECLLDCVVGDGIDLEIGEGCTIIGCTFTRAYRLNLCEAENKELFARHKIVIEPHTVMIGCALKDEVTVGCGSRIVSSVLSQCHIGKKATILLSSLLLRFGSIGDNAVLFHAWVHMDPATIGDNALFMDGILALCDPEDVVWNYNKDIALLVRTMIGSMWTQERIKMILYETIKNLRIKEKEWKERDTEDWRVPKKFCQFCHGEHAAEYVGLNRRVPLTTPAKGSWDGFTTPLVFQISDNIRKAGADQETFFQINLDAAKEFYTENPKRIKIGNNFRVHTPFAFRMGALKTSNTYSSHSYNTPPGLARKSWNKNVQHSYDFLAGNDVAFLAHTKWLCAGFMGSSDIIGRLVLSDGARVYNDRADTLRYTTSDASLTKVKITSSGLSHNWPASCAITLGKNARLFVKGVFGVLTGREDSMINSIIVEDNGIALI